MTAERVDHFVTRLDERRLEHVGEKREDWVERLELLLSNGTIDDACHKLGEDGEVENERRGQERVFALVEDVKCVLLTRLD